MLTFKKYLLVVVLLFLLNDTSFASTGCLRSGQVYTTPPSGWYQWESPTQSECPVGASTSTQYASINSTSSTRCTTGFLGFGGNGVLVDYDIEYCPIDDYVPLIILLLGGITSVLLRRNYLLTM